MKHGMKMMGTGGIQIYMCDHNHLHSTVCSIPFMSKMNINSTNWSAHNVCNLGQNVKTNGCYLV